MGPVGALGDSIMARDDRLLAAARDAYGEKWDFYRVFGGFVALPAGAPFIQSSDVDGLVEKIATRISGRNTRITSRKAATPSRVPGERPVL